MIFVIFRRDFLTFSVHELLCINFIFGLQNFFLSILSAISNFSRGIRGSFFRSDSLSSCSNVHSIKLFLHIFICILVDFMSFFKKPTERFLLCQTFSFLYFYWFFFFWTQLPKASVIVFLKKKKETWLPGGKFFKFIFLMSLTILVFLKIENC